MSAIHNLGVMYTLGMGVAKDEKKGVDLILLAAEAGLAEAELALGFLLSEGKLLPKNFERAFAFFEKAARKRSGLAQYALARAYTTGQGVERNLVRAYAWFLEARKNGYGDPKIGQELKRRLSKKQVAEAQKLFTSGKIYDR